MPFPKIGAFCCGYRVCERQSESEEVIKKFDQCDKNYLNQNYEEL